MYGMGTVYMYVRINSSILHYSAGFSPAGIRHGLAQRVSDRDCSNFRAAGPRHHFPHSFGSIVDLYIIIITCMHALESTMQA